MRGSVPTICLRRAILNRRRSWVDRLALLGARTFFPNLLRSVWDPLGGIIQHNRVLVVAYSDVELDLARQISWGDYWFKYELTKEIGKLGFAVVDEWHHPDIMLHLFGHPVDLEPFASAHKVLWIHSNPDKITAEILQQYDYIACISDSFAREIRDMGFRCSVVQQGTSKHPLFGVPKKYEVVFVGNARAELGGTRQIVVDMGEPDYDFKVWGAGYRTLSSQYWAGEYCDYHALGELYASSCISLNDHRPAMAAKGFINPRVFDILAAGGFCISDSSKAITDLFGDAVPQYSSASHLRELVTHFLAHPDERDILAQKGRAITAQYSWNNVAATLFTDISPKHEK